MQTDLSIYNSLRPSFIEGVHAVKFNALSAVISRYRDYARSSEQIKAYSGDSLLMRDIASLLDEAPRPITREYQDFTPFLLLLMLSEEFHAVHYVERLVTWYFGYCCVDELRTVCTILSECSYPHHDTLRLRFKNYLREARKTLGMPVECNAAVMLKMLDASYEHLTPADVGEFEELLHLGDDYEFISRVKSTYRRGLRVFQHDYLPPAFPAGFRLLGLLVVTSAPYRTYRGVVADDTLHVAGNSLHVRFLRPIPLYGLLQAEYGEQSHFHPPGRSDLTLKSAP
mgnify:CR=1 FL=1